ncbi:MAG: hypothetical protein ACD_11C00024G0018 [uncultured bacterium]|nr:MAG: hypothetical protein ACD_11C00024G0018 [uncultured bacterium]HBR72001.1 phenylalanine--tRNA ligase subunit beta [Candidatus Moranbacteria bacterium]
MKYSYKWLKELSGTKKSAQEIAELLTFHSFEIEGLEKNEMNFDKVVVGEILEISAHPNADKLRIAKVDVGKNILEIVCGAPNIQVGQKVPVALVGAKLPNGLKIEEAEIRGVKSFGMLCAEDELGLGSDHGGIFILGNDLKAGISFSDALDLDDTVIEIDVLSNRAHDALSHIGMAREIAAIEKNKIDYDYAGLNLPKKKSDKISVDIEDSSICFRYIGAMIENVKISDSPQWLKNRLKKSGIKSINNIVDATNYVMLETGQPLHAFDGEKISNINVRKAKAGEKIKILDGTEKELNQNDIVITDGEKAIALAGIMGGFDSGVSEQTTSIVLEAANFDASSIRQTRMRLGLATDAAIRFEKQIDPNLAEKAMVRAIEIIAHISGGKLEGICDMYPQEVKPWKIKLNLEYANKLLGENIPFKKAKEILKLLELRVSGYGAQVVVEIPTFRIDLKNQEDLIEEIGRINGYKKIEAVAPFAPVKIPRLSEAKAFERILKNTLVAQGFDEVYNYSFYSQKDAFNAELAAMKHIELENPMNPDQNFMRINLFPNLLKNVRENLKNFKEVSLFEIGHIYSPSEEVLPEEKNMLAGAMVFDRKNEKDSKGGVVEFFEAKREIDALLRSFGIGDYYYDTFEPVSLDSSTNFWHSGRTAEIKIEGKENSIGFFGEINPLVLANFDIQVRVVAFEIDVKKMQEVVEKEREYQPLRKFPVVVRDMSMISNDKSVRVDDILEAMQSVGGDLLLDVDLFDIFDFADGSTSLAFHLTLGSVDRTLKGEEVDRIISNIEKGLEEKFGIKLRK